MTNEQYLVVSYIVLGVTSLGIALAVYHWLLPSFTRITKALPNKQLSRILRRLFLIGIVLPAFLGFFSVSFRSCSRDTYQKIVEDRAYLVEKNQAQMSNTLVHLVVALFIWGIIVGGVLLIIKRSQLKKGI